MNNEYCKSEKEYMLSPKKTLNRNSMDLFPQLYNQWKYKVLDFDIRVFFEFFKTLINLTKLKCKVDHMY